MICDKSNVLIFGIPALNYSEVLQKYLLRVARGELNDTTTILPLLKAATLYLPQTKTVDFNSIVKITFPLVHKNNQQLIPVYLSKSNSSTYSGTLTNLKAQILDPIEIKGEMLLDVIPPEFGLIVEPSSSLEVIFDYHTIKHFLEGMQSYKFHRRKSTNTRSQTAKDTEEKIPAINANPALEDIYTPLSQQVTVEPEPNPRVTDTDIPIYAFQSTDTKNKVSPTQESSVNLHVITGGKDSSTGKDSIGIEEMIDELSAKAHARFDISKLERELINIVSSYSGVEEAYLLEHASPHSELILGLLVKDWVEDERFRIVESVAIVSKDMFGYAGAIEVYDDLNDTHSSSWDLFKMIPPFYTRETNAEEKTTTPPSDEDNKRGLRGSMSRLTKTGLKFFANHSRES